MGIMLTERAAEEVKKAREANRVEDAMFLRIGVRGGGCAGFDYSMHFDMAFDESKDDRFEFHGVQVVVDKKSEFFIGGTILDFNDGLLDRGFVFKNPQATGSCGCGTSFSA